MLSSKEFKQLPYAEKKNEIKSLIASLTTASISFDDIVFLLDASGTIHESTLDIIYDQAHAMIEQIKIGAYDVNQKEAIKYAIAHDVAQEQEAKNADSLLNQI